MKGVAPNGSMLASSILLIMELPAIEAARPALKPAWEHARHTNTQHRTERRVGQTMAAWQCPRVCRVEAATQRVRSGNSVIVRLPGQMMRVLSTGRFSLLVVNGVMLKEPQDWVLRLTRLSVGEQGLLAAEQRTNIYRSHRLEPNTIQLHSGITRTFCFLLPTENMLINMLTCWFFCSRSWKWTWGQLTLQFLTL